jgi:phosphatidylglycerol:prolipoprotein diacylglycerol transferase
LTVYSYGAILAFGFVVGMVLILLKARKQGIPLDRMIELFCLSIFSALVGARGFHVLLDLAPYVENPLRILKVWEGGLVFYGGLILAIGAGLVYMRGYRLPIWKVADLFAPAIALGLFFARIGCFMAGCCFGKETSLPWGVRFSDPDSLAPLHLSLHPTQLYEAAGGFVLFLLLAWMERRKSFDGQTFWLFLLLYSILRFFIECLRDDPRGFLIWPSVSTSQTLGVPLAILSLFVLFYMKRGLRR